MDAPVPRAARGRAPVAKSPELTMEEAKAKLLRHAYDVLSDKPHSQAAETDGALGGALAIIEMLTVHMTAAAHSRLHPEQQKAFMSDLKRSVAAAVADLASSTKR